LFLTIKPSKKMTRNNILKINIILFIMACSQIVVPSNLEMTIENKIDHEIMIDVPGSELYVRVRGNPAKPIIVDLHGGPGGYSGIV
jgi:hypothetical protein